MTILILEVRNNDNTNCYSTKIFLRYFETFICTEDIYCYYDLHISLNYVYNNYLIYFYNLINLVVNSFSCMLYCMQKLLYKNKTL